MERQPDEDKPITLTREPQVLANFILALLEQPRRIEQSFRDNIFIINYEWCCNLIEICKLRMEQHPYGICSFSCDILYENRRVDNISSTEAFYAYLNNNKWRSVGVDLSISFLVSFGTKPEPEKQDLRVQIFSDESYKLLAKKAINSSEPDSVISYSISFSNLTWGEDMSRHINTHIYTALKDGIFTQLLRYISSIEARVSTVLIFLAGFIASVFVMSRQVIQFSERKTEFTRHNAEEFSSLLRENTMEAISKKLNIIMKELGFDVFPTTGFNWPVLILIVSITPALAPYIAHVLTRRFCVSFLVFNDFTKALSTKYIATNEKLKWLVISAVVGIPFALVTAYIKGLFPLMPFHAVHH